MRQPTVFFLSVCLLCLALGAGTTLHAQDEAGAPGPQNTADFCDEGPNYTSFGDNLMPGPPLY